MLKIHWQDTYLTNSKILPMGDGRPTCNRVRVPWVWGLKCHPHGSPGLATRSTQHRYRCSWVEVACRSRAEANPAAETRPRCHRGTNHGALPQRDHVTSVYFRFRPAAVLPRCKIKHRHFFQRIFIFSHFKLVFFQDVLSTYYHRVLTVSLWFVRDLWAMWNVFWLIDWLK